MILINIVCYQYDSDGEEIAFNPACRTCGLPSFTYLCQGKCRNYYHRECLGMFHDQEQVFICFDCSASKITLKNILLDIDDENDIQID